MLTSATPSVTVTLPRDAHALEAVKRASYALMARYDVSLALSDAEIACTLTAATDRVTLETAARDFRREVTDQDLRLSIEASTGAYRDTILGLAFSKTGLQDG